MLVRHRMRQHPVTVSPQDTLTTAQEKMTVGHFRRLPVVHDGALVGILTDRDVRRHVGVEERMRVGAAMTETPLTVSPLMTVEEAVQLMLKHQISGLPVVENGKVAGIIITSDVLQAFLEMTGASTQGSARIDLLRTEKGGNLAEAATLINGIAEKCWEWGRIGTRGASNSFSICVCEAWALRRPQQHYRTRDILSSAYIEWRTVA